MGRTGAGVGISVLALGIFAGLAPGAVNTFTSRPTWQASAGAINAVESFSGFAVDTPFRTATVACNAFTLRQEGDPANTFRNEIDVPPPNFGDGNGTASASCFTNFAEASNNGGTQVRVAFPTAVAAFGADFYNANDGEGLVVNVFSGNTLLNSTAVAQGSPAFFGFVATAGEQITSLLFRSNNLTVGVGGEGFMMDDVALRTVPEPAAAGALLAGTVALALGRRRCSR